jgi:hypothetical protein
MRWIRRSIGWIAGLAIGGFLLWIVGTAVSIQGMQADAAGALFGRTVPTHLYLNALQAVSRQAILTHGDNAAKALPKEQLENQAWERLMLLAEARSKRIRVSDREVSQEISQWPIFHDKNGDFDRQSYEAILRYTLGVPPRIFEEEIRESLTVAKLVQRPIGDVQLEPQDLLEPVSEKPRQVTEEELLTKKRIKAYFTWYQDLLKRANLKKGVSLDLP